MTYTELHDRQAWPLEQKIDHTVGAIDAFLAYCREHGRNPYVSFSGGLDSTVLLHLARKVFGQDLKGVFCSTGNEFPEIMRFVRHTPNVEIIRPTLTPRQVMEQYGFPLVSKEQAQAVRQIRTTGSDKLKERRLDARKVGSLATRWQYLVSEPYDTSEKCCEMLKKRPFRHYNARTSSIGMVGTRAGESRLRQSQYLRRGGCNAFDDDPAKVHSAPLSIWTDADVREYIRHYNVPYCELYDIPGVTRTGCAFCGFGANASPQRFYMLRDRYPKLYEMCLNYTNRGYTFRYALFRMGINLP